VDFTDKNGRTPLRVAAGKGHVEVVLELLSHGASVNFADHYSWTTLWIAGEEG